MGLEGGVQRHNERAKEAKILMRNNRQDQATFSLSATVGGNLQLLGEKNVIASFICQGQIQYRSYFWIWARVSTRVWLSVLSEGKDQWFLSLLMDILSSDPFWVKESCSIFHQFHRSKCFSTHNLILMPHTCHTHSCGYSKSNNSSTSCRYFLQHWAKTKWLQKKWHVQSKEDRGGNVCLQWRVKRKRLERSIAMQKIDRQSLR